MAALLVATVGSFSQAVTGFGFAVVAVPLLALFVDTRVAIVGITALSTLLTVGTSVWYRHDVDWAMTARLSIAALVGMPLGLIALAAFDSSWLSILVACAVVLFATLTFSNVTWQNHPRNAYGAGFVGGVFLTSIGMNGPPFVFALQAFNFSPRRMRATLQSSFAIQDVFAVLGFALIGQVSADTGIIVLGGLLGVVLGWLIGSRLFAIIPSTQFRWIIGFTLLGSAIALVLQGVFG